MFAMCFSEKVLQEEGYTYIQASDEKDRTLSKYICEDQLPTVSGNFIIVLNIIVNFSCD